MGRKRKIEEEEEPVTKRSCRKREQRAAVKNGSRKVAYTRTMRSISFEYGVYRYSYVWHQPRSPGLWLLFACLIYNLKFASFTSVKLNFIYSVFMHLCSCWKHANIIVLIPTHVVPTMSVKCVCIWVFELWLIDVAFLNFTAVKRLTTVVGRHS